MARLFEVPPNSLENRLKRYRRGHSDGWQEIEDAKPNEPRYLYQLSAVSPIIEDLQKTTAQRPAK